MIPDSRTLHAEASLFAKYLVGAPAPPDLAERYASGCHALFKQPGPGDLSIVQLARQHVWLVAPMDTAAALIRPTSLLRKKILLMAAILETSPEHAEKFLPRPLPLRRLIALGLSILIASAVRLPIGVLAIWFAERRA